ncbi:MAG: hypothetical protein AB7P37_09610 [Ramlibacter sp.]
MHAGPTGLSARRRVLLGAAALAAVPLALRAQPRGGFYAQWVDAGGLPVMASARVDPLALQAAAQVVQGMLARRADLLAVLRAAGVRVAVIGRDELTTDLPEYADLQPREHWNARTRGVGATRERPVCSVAEENLLGLTGDRYRGESILVHEFAHTVFDLAATRLDAALAPRLRTLYRQAMDAGLWQRTYAAANASEYWAEGVQSWFDANRHQSAANGVHGPVATRAALKAHDPALADVIAGVFGDTPWRWDRPGLHAGT